MAIKAFKLLMVQKKSTKLSKPLVGHYAKATAEAGAGLKEFRIPSTELENYKLNSQITVELFKPGQKVDVTGITIGKGFQGPIKRHHFSSNRATHGVSISHNSHGSTGQCQDPGRVFPGKKMAGHLEQNKERHKI